MSVSVSDPCPDDELAAAMAGFGSDQSSDLKDVEGLLDRYPDDPRLLFLKGSILAGLEQYADARHWMEEALRRSPTYAIARFQLGFLELASGEAAAALATWRPLHGLADDNPLRLFARGLEYLVEDAYAPAIQALNQGIACNRDIAPLNADMRLIIAQVEALMAAPPASPRTEASPEEISATHLLLQQYKGGRPTRH